MAVGVSIRLAAFASGLMAGPLYAHWKVAGAPADEDKSAMLFATAETYLAKLAVTVQLPFAVGSQTTPTRGLQPLSRATRLPMLSTPWFLSNRSPRFNVRLPFHRKVSFTNAECVRKLVPWLLRLIGSYSRIVRFAPVVSSCG